METFDAIETRESVRGYIDEQITDMELHKVLSVGNKAPNAGPIHLTVIQNQEFLKEINDKTKQNMLDSEGFMRERASIEGYEPLYGAPTLVVISSPEVPFADINVACSATTMLIAATDIGLGSCYVVSPIQTLVEYEFLERLNLPDEYVPISAILLGYPSENQIEGVGKEEEDIINYIK